MPGPFKSQYSPRVAAMLRHLNLFSAGGPLPGAPGSLLMKPATSPRYEFDLVQLQQSTRAQAANGQRAQAAPKQARLLYKSTSLPKNLLPRNQALNLEAERDAAAERKARGETDFDFRVDGLRTPEQLQQLREQSAKSQRAKENEVYERLMPDNVVTDALGKAWASPITLAGAAAGSLNVLAARLAGKKDARISVGNNALQFEGGLLGSDRSAFTAGNSVLYGPGGHPEMRARRYDKRPTSVSVGEHEMGHTYQYYSPPFPALYLGSRIVDKINGRPYRYEAEADDFAEEAYRRRRR